jgi:hypothetical protein
LIQSYQLKQNNSLIQIIKCRGCLTIDIHLYMYMHNV